VLAAVEGEYGGVDSDAGERLVDYAAESPAACASRAMAERKTLKSPPHCAARAGAAKRRIRSNVASGRFIVGPASPSRSFPGKRESVMCQDNHRSAASTSSSQV